MVPRVTVERKSGDRKRKNRNSVAVGESIEAKKESAPSIIGEDTFMMKQSFNASPAPEDFTFEMTKGEALI